MTKPGGHKEPRTARLTLPPSAFMVQQKTKTQGKNSIHVRVLRTRPKKNTKASKLKNIWRITEAFGKMFCGKN